MIWNKVTTLGLRILLPGLWHTDRNIDRKAQHALDEDSISPSDLNNILPKYFLLFYTTLLLLFL